MTVREEPSLYTNTPSNPGPSNVPLFKTSEPPPLTLTALLPPVILPVVPESLMTRAPPVVTSNALIPVAAVATFPFRSSVSALLTETIAGTAISTKI